MVLDQRYELLELLKGSRGVETYLATDLEADGARVVVKLLRTGVAAPALIMRLEHEASVLTRLQGPNFPLSRFGTSEGSLYLVQPYLPGETLAQRLSRGPLSVADTLVLASDLLSTLQEAHHLAILHRDVKPGNIILQESSPLTKATLIDFGLSFSASLDPEIRQEAVGTARYLAPEQAGAVDAIVDERSDLYSVGVVLYECLAGRPPFDALTVGEVLRQHLSLAVPGLRSAGVEVPRALDAIVARLLAKEPGKRYQSAAGALADITQLSRALAKGIAEPPMVIGLGDNRGVLAEPAFVGRFEELDALAEHLQTARRGRGGLVLLAAESGGGKTRLLQEFAEQAAAGGAWIARGQGVDQTAQRPYQLLEGVAEAIGAEAAQNPGLQDHIRARLGDRAEAIATALPELADIVGHASSGSLPEAHGEIRSLEALTALLGSLGTARRPALIVLDDCQWADGLTAKLLDRWQDISRSTRTYVLVVAAFRSEEVGEHHPLARIEPEAEITLRPLSPPEIRDMAQSMAGTLPEEAVQTVAQLSEGSPFMAAAVLMGLIECGAVVESPGGWTVNEQALADAQTSRRAAIFLVRRLERLPLSALRLLSVGAVLGKDFSLSLAASLTDLETEDIASALAEAKGRRIVWLDDGLSRCHFVHDKIREALLGSMTTEERTSLHLRAAEHIEGLDPSRIFELAYHFDAAGAGERALPYALAAAENARRQHTLEISEAHYRMAERATPNSDADNRLEIAEGLGDVLTLRGAYEEAVVQFRNALELSHERVQRARLQGKLGDVAFRCGDMVGARTHLEGALHQLKARMPRTMAGVVAALLWEVWVQTLHSIAPRSFLGRRPIDDADIELQAIRIYSRLAYVYWFHSGKIRCGWAHLREMNLAERYPPTLELAQAYSEHAPVMTMIPWFGRGLDYVESSLEIRTALGDVWGQGQSLSFSGVALYAGSRYREAIERCREAKRLMERTGDRWEVNTAGWNIALAQYRLGELKNAVNTAREVHAAALDIGDQAAAGISLSAWARAAGGDLPAELIQAQMDRGDLEDASTNVEVHLAEAVRLLGSGETERAVEVLTAARAIVRRAGLRQEYVAPILPWLATALRMRAETVSARSAVPRRQLRQAVKVAAKAGRISRSYRNNRPQALRERGLLAALAGRPRTAHRRLTASLQEARSQEARFEEAQSLIAIGRVGQVLAWTDARTSLQAGEELLKLLVGTSGQEEPERQDTLSLADRFTTLVEMGRTIASASEPAGVYSAVREAALTLLRGDQCIVLDVHGRASGSLVLMEDNEALSRTMVERAIDEGGPVVVNIGDEMSVTESLVLSGVRSVLCAPIASSEGFTEACFYVTHSQVGGLFGPEEIQVASFIATLAGAALDQVAGSEARFTSLAQNSSDVISIVGERGLIDYQSSSVQRVFGLQPLEMMGSRFSSWIHPEDSPAVLAEMHRIVEEGRNYATIECRLRTAGGAWRWTETTLTNLVDDPSVRGVVLNTRDITERKALEEERRKDEEALRISEDRARAAMDQALEASRLKSQFLATMSHEIRTPMNGVLGMAHLLLDTETTPLQHRYLLALQESGANLLEIINDILDFSKVEAGKLELERIDFNLHQAVEGCAAMFSGPARSKGLELTLQISSEVAVWVNGDPVRLRQILINLTSNAVKFTDRGGVEIEVSSSSAGLIRFRVSDTGIGIGPQDRQNLLDPFVQADASTTRRFGGTGLGLAISHQLAQLMGGILDFDSQPGAGSTFWFEIPLMAAAHRPAEGAPAGEPAKTAIESPVSGRVLLVEDSLVNQLVATGMLEKIGYEVAISATGAEAVEMASSRRYDVILMDCLMPVMDGYEATRRIRHENGPNRRTPIVALTASAMNGDREKCLAAGMNDYLSKPLDPAALAALIGQFAGAGARN